MNAAHNGHSRRDDYEVQAIYDDAGTPPRSCLKDIRRAQTLQKRREQLDHFDLWLRTLQRENPIGYVLLSLACGAVVGGVLFGVLTLLDWLSNR